MDINTVLNGTQLYDNDGMYSYGMKKNLSPRKITIGRQDHKHEKFGRRKKFSLAGLMSKFTPINPIEHTCSTECNMLPTSVFKLWVDVTTTYKLLYDQ